MTEQEWMKTYPEDWKLASEAEDYNPDQYSFMWSSDYTKFRLVKLAWEGNKDYANYQGGE